MKVGEALTAAGHAVTVEAGPDLFVWTRPGADYADDGHGLTCSERALIAEARRRF